MTGEILILTPDEMVEISDETRKRFKNVPISQSAFRRYLIELSLCSRRGMEFKREYPCRGKGSLKPRSCGMLHCATITLAKRVAHVGKRLKNQQIL